MPVCLFGQTPPALQSRTPFVLGETVEFHSDILGEARTLNVYLPAGYSPDSARQYPVIYLLDGSEDEDFIHIAGLVQFATFPWIEYLPESILVGIANVDRRRDFSYPTTIEKDKVAFPTTGHSAPFLQFIEQELQPFVEKNYKTSPQKTLLGQSLGGLLAAEILIKKPQLFTHYIIVSPSLWWDDRSLLDVPFAAGHKASVYIAVGKEGRIMKSSARKLSKLAAATHHQVAYKYYPNADHANILHLAAYDAIVQLFGKKKK